MTQREQIEELREEIAGLRKQLSDLAVAVASQPHVQYVPYPVQTPTWPAQPHYYTTCGGDTQATFQINGGVSV